MTREEAIKRLKEYEQYAYGIWHNEEEDTKAFDMAIEALSGDRPSGEWIDIDNYYRMATCSHCHKVTMFEKWGEYTQPYNYCPNCEAMMVREDGDDNEID